MSKRIIVIGDVMLDVIVRPARDIAPSSDTPSTVRLGRGGSGANLAVALAAQHHDVHYLGAVGEDIGGRMFLDDLTRSGVTCDLEVGTGSTGVVVALVAMDGERAMLSDRGANRDLSIGHVLAGLAPGFDHLHVSGYTLLDDATREAGVVAIRTALECAVSVSVDVCSLAPLLETTPAVFLEAAAGSTMIFANEEESRALSGAGDVDGALEFLGERFDEVVVTRGANGAVAARGAEVVRSPALNGVVVDTTGAGDAATGAYLGARLHGRGLVEALASAMEAASVVIRGLGSLGG